MTRITFASRRLRRVAAVFAATVIAVAGSVQAAAALSVDSSWSTAVLPQVNVRTAVLNAVSCPTATSCFAVGSTEPAAPELHTVALRKVGSSWVDMGAPDAIGSLYTQLTGISCASTTQCVAVGINGDDRIGGVVVAYAVKWDGTSWTRIRPAFNTPLATEGSRFNAVSCPAVNNCTAVGSLGYDEDRALIEHWNGTRWHIVASPVPSDALSYLHAVDCVSTSFCVAAGRVQESSGSTRPLTEQLTNGRYEYRRPIGPAESFSAVSCTARNACTAVGDIDDAGQIRRCDLCLERQVVDRQRRCRADRLQPITAGSPQCRA